jgi:hypothetical protein
VFVTVPAPRCTAEEALHRVRDTRPDHRCVANPFAQEQSVPGQKKWEATMKLTLSAVTFLALFSISLGAARSETCSVRAQNCVMTWGGPRAACYEAFRLAACERTGKYVAPNGNVWPASRTDRKTGSQG